MNRQKLLWVIALVVGVALVLSPVLQVNVQAQDECNFEGDPIRIGATGPLSAPGSVRGGIDMQWAFNIGEADANAECGVTIDGVQHPIEVIFGDTEGLPERGVAVAERLINENNVVAIVGEYHSSVGLAIMEVVAETGTPTVFSETYNDNITASMLPNVFRIAPVSSIVAGIVTDWMLSQEPEAVVIIAENTDFGIPSAEASQAQLEAAGVSVEVIFVDPGTEDFVPILSRIQAAGVPDIIDTSLITGETNYNVVQQMTELGLAPTPETVCIANQVAGTPEFWNAAPDAAYCVFRKVGLGPASYNEIAASVAERYNADIGGEPQSWTFEAYDSLLIMVNAIRNAGSTDPAAIIEALEATDIDGAQGHYYFTYGASNPVPDDVPAYMWHQWPEPAVLIQQYTEPNQSVVDAPVIWPPVYMTQEYVAPME